MVLTAAMTSALFPAEAGEAGCAPQAKGEQPPRLSGRTSVSSGTL